MLCINLNVRKCIKVIYMYIFFQKESFDSPHASIVSGNKVFPYYKAIGSERQLSFPCGKINSDFYNLIIIILPIYERRFSVTMNS